MRKHTRSESFKRLQRAFINLHVINGLRSAVKSQISAECEIGFGTRRPVVRIHSPRPIPSNYLRRGQNPEDRPTWALRQLGFGPGALAITLASLAFTPLEGL